MARIRPSFTVTVSTLFFFLSLPSARGFIVSPLSKVENTNSCYPRIEAVPSDAGKEADHDSETTTVLKSTLLQNLKELRALQEIDGDFSIDFGVKGGELNETSRAPRKVNYYGISDRVGEAADRVMDTCKRLEPLSPIEEPTAFLGDKNKGKEAPLSGTWKLLFTTAADASFSKNSTRGDARAKNVVDAKSGRITNVIDFTAREKEDGTTTEPALKQLNVIIQATPVSNTRVDLQFKYAEAVVTRFFGIPLFGRTLPLYIPIPATFLTRIIVLFGRIFRRKGIKKPPVPFFEVTYLDEDLRIHRTGEGNIFVQAKGSWEEAMPLLQ